MPRASGSHIADSASSGDPDADALQRIVSILHWERLNQGLTLRDLKERMGISHAHLSQPGLVVLRWCRALDLKFGDVWKQVSREK